jgi:hypothetical protein
VEESPLKTNDPHKSTGYAPGYSAYISVERHMDPVSRDLSGLILSHSHYESHFDNGMMCDEELERTNLQKAGKVLAEI